MKLAILALVGIAAAAPQYGYGPPPYAYGPPPYAYGPPRGLPGIANALGNAAGNVLGGVGDVVGDIIGNFLPWRTVDGQVIPITDAQIEQKQD